MNFSERVPRNFYELFGVKESGRQRASFGLVANMNIIHSCFYFIHKSLFLIPYIHFRSAVTCSPRPFFYRYFFLLLLQKLVLMPLISIQLQYFDRLTSRCILTSNTRDLPAWGVAAFDFFS